MPSRLWFELNARLKARGKGLARGRVVDNGEAEHAEEKRVMYTGHSTSETGVMFQVKSYFKLAEGFLAQYRGQQPDWGPLGYITFKRTYARVIDAEQKRTEEYWETLRRVVKGCYTIQMNHCHALKLPWKPDKAQRSAQEMFKLMWDFKFLPPRRGLWMMGSDYIYIRKYAALNNCASCPPKRSTPTSPSLSASSWTCPCWA